MWIASSLLIVVTLQSTMSDQRLEQFVNLNHILTNKHNYISAFFKLIGSPFAYGNHFFAFIIGIFGLFSLLILVYFGAWKQHVVFSFAIFLIASLAVIALSWAGAGHDYLIVSADRYRFIAFNYWICLFLLVLRVAPRHTLLISSSIMLTVFALSIFTFDRRAPIVKEFYYGKIKGFQSWQQTGEISYLLTPFGYSSSKTKNDLERIIEEKKYAPPFSSNN
jgi:hypothetical protein